MVVTKKKKTPKPSIHENYLAKNTNWEDLIAEETISWYPGKDEWRKRFIRTLFMEAISGDILEIWEFCEKYCISPYRILTWTKQYEDIAQAYDQFKQIIASKRRAGCMRKKLDSYSSFRDIHLLDKQDDEVNRYHFELKKLKDLEEQVKYLVEIVRPQTITPEQMKHDREERYKE